jgi:putative nucleotidyltransferase with HDIG domain
LIRSVLEELREKADHLGMVLQAWDRQGQLLDAHTGVNDVCRFRSASPMGWTQPGQKLAEYVLERGEPSRSTSSLGCCLLGLPIYDRRRLVGVMVVGYPTREMLDDEHLARVCSRVGLDLEIIRRVAPHACRHSSAEAPHMAQVFQTLIHDRLEAQKLHAGVNSLSNNLADIYEELSLLYHISGSMRVSQKPREFLQDICDHLLEVMDLEIASAVVYDIRTEMDEDIIVQAGSGKIRGEQIRLLAAAHIAPHIAGDNTLLVNNDFGSTCHTDWARRIQSFLAVPLMIDTQSIGVLVGINKQSGRFNSFDAKLMGSIANQASIFLANSRMYAELKDLLMGVLHSLTEAIDAKDPYTCGHSRRVASISRRLAEASGFEPERVQHIYLAGLLHDIGKIGVAEQILCKDGRLSEEEYDVIKRHPAIGAKILRRIRNLEPIIAGVLTHHERFDGRGYPKGLKGMEIPIEGRIICLADSWDAMTSQRTYRKALNLQRAREEITRCSGTQFDPNLVAILLSWDLDAFMRELRSANGEDLHLLDERLY